MCAESISALARNKSDFALGILNLPSLTLETMKSPMLELVLVSFEN